MFEDFAIAAVVLARKHHKNKVDMQTSAELCYKKAYSQLQDRNFTAAVHMACRSLKFSVGVFHPDCKTVVAFLEEMKRAVEISKK